MVHAAWSEIGGGLVHQFADPTYWIFVALLTILGLIWPAQRAQHRPLVALAEDAVWFLGSTVLTVTVVTGVLNLVGMGYTALFGSWSLNLTPVLGVWGVAVLAFVIADALNWGTHWTHHHVPQLWHFHAVHHSQERLNALSDNRTHVVENVVGGVIAFVPGILLGLNTPQAVLLAYSTIYFSAVIHSNVRTDFGPLRYLFISPQAHRVHHSVDPSHFNTNYGTVFSVWDYLLRTRFHDHTVYPETGIQDPAFPHDTTGRPLSVLALFVRQTIHPFRQLFGLVPATSMRTGLPVPSLMGPTGAARGVHSIGPQSIGPQSIDAEGAVSA